jgi:hypothetical protein
MIAYIFAGMITGLFIVSIFNPVKHEIPELPTPGIDKVFRTKAGCVKIHAEEVQCSSQGISLNVIND